MLWGCVRLAFAFCRIFFRSCVYGGFYELVGVKLGLSVFYIGIEGRELCEKFLRRWIRLERERAVR